MKNLKIGFDGKRAVMNYTGIGNYSRLALQCIHNVAPDNRLLIYTPRIKSNPRLAPLLELKGVELHRPDTLFGRLAGSVWRSRGICSQLRRDGLDLYHGLSNELPLGIDRCPFPSVVTIHDLIFRRHPEFYHRADVSICDRKFSYAARAATRVIAISERTKADIVELYGVDPAKIDIVYQGCADIFHQPIAAEEIARVRQKYALSGPYIIGVGTVEARKNQLLTLRALANLPKDVSLVIVGRHTAYGRQMQAEAERLGLTSRVCYIQGAPFTDLPPLYAGAVAAAYPSFYEGFGIPMLEAIAAGVPVVAATGSCLEEAGGPGAIYVDPTSVGDFTDAMRSLIDDDALRRRMVADGRRHIARFAGENFGADLVKVYQSML